MSIGVVDATLKVTGFKQLKAQAEKAGKSLAGINSKLEEASGGMKAMGAAGAVAFAGMALAANKAVKAFGVQVRAERSLEAAFKGLGEGAAGAAAEIKELAASLQRTTTFGDEATIKAAAFLRVQGMTTDQIKAALPVIQDFAALTGQDLAKASILAGRAMTGNVKVLERYLGSIDNAKAAQIDALGPAEKAIAVTALLTEKVGGQAALLRQSGVGAMEAYANSVGDLWEELGELIDQPVREFFEGSIESVEAMTSAIGNLQPWAKDLLVTVAKWAAVFTAAAAGIAAVALVIPQIVTGLGLMKAAWLSLAPSIWAALVPLLPFLAVIGVLVLVIAGLRKTWHDFGSAFVFEAKEMFNSASDVVFGWAKSIKKLFEELLNGLVKGLRSAINELGELAFALGLEDMAKQIKSFENISFDIDFSEVKSRAQVTAEAAKSAFVGMADTAAGAGSSIAGAFSGAFNQVSSGLALLKKDIAGAVFSPTVKAAGKAAGKASSSAGAGASAPGVANAGAALKAAGDAEVKTRAANTAAFKAQTSRDLEAVKRFGAGTVSHYEKIADAYDKVAAAWEDRAARQAQQTEGQQLGAVSAVGSAMKGNLGGMVTGIASAVGKAFGPVASAVIAVADSFISMSKEGALFKEKLSGLFQSLAVMLDPFFRVLNALLTVLDPVVAVYGRLHGVISEVMIALSFMQPALWLVGKALGVIGIIISNVIIGLRSAYIGILRMIDAFTPADFTREIAQLEAAQNSEVAARNDMIDTLQGQEAATKGVIKASEDAAKQLGTLNVPSGFKLARAAFNADRGRLAPQANDFISRPGMPVQRFSRADTLIGFDGGGPLGGGGGGGGSTTYDIGEVHIHGVDDPEDFWNKIKEATRFQVDRGGAALPLNSQFSGV